MSGRVDISFKCPKCGETVYKKNYPLCEPNWAEDKAIDRIADSGDYVCCEQCGNEIYLDIYNDYGDIWIYNNDLEELNYENVRYDADDDFFEWYSKSNEFYEDFNDSITEYKTILKSNYAKDNQSILKMVDASIVSAMETFLGDVLISMVKKNEKYLLNASKNLKDFKDEKITISEILECPECAKLKIINGLRGLLYHNLPKVKMVYKLILEIDIKGDLQPLMQIVSRRHDIIHRNGKNNNGEMFCFSKEQVLNDVCLIEQFIQDVNDDVKLLLNEK